MSRAPFVRLALVCASVLSPASACAPDGGAGADAGDVVADAGPEMPDGLFVLNAIEDLASLEGVSGSVKYLAPVDGVAPRPPVGDECAFQNTARYPYHLEYLRAQPGGEELDYQDYLSLVLRRPTRAWWGGDVRWSPDGEHPLNDEPGVLSYTLYTEDSPGNRLQIDDVRAIHAALTTCAPAFQGTLAFVPGSNEQRLTAASIRDTLAGEGIAILVE